MTNEYKVKVTRDGRWWMIEVPEIDGLTQARRVSEIEEMARSLIAISTDRPLSDITVHIASITVPGLGDVASGAREIEYLRDEAQQIEAKAASAVVRYAKEMAREGVPVRDTAALLGISPQRVSQLTNAAAANR